MVLNKNEVTILTKKMIASSGRRRDRRDEGCGEKPRGVNIYEDGLLPPHTAYGE